MHVNRVFRGIAQQGAVLFFVLHMEWDLEAGKWV